MWGYCVSQNDLKKRVQGAGAGESEELSRLREENERLRQAAKRPGTPQRSQTLIGGETNIQVHLMFFYSSQLHIASLYLG